MSHFLSGITDEILQTKRGQMLETTKADLVNVAEQYLIAPQAESKTSKVIFGAKSDEVDTNLIENGWIYEDFNAPSLKRGKYEGGEEMESW